MNDVAFSSVIINYGGSKGQAEALKARLLSKNPDRDVLVISLSADNLDNLSEKDKDILGRIGSQSKIYIIGHCRSNSTYIGDLEHKGVHYQDVAELLAKNVDPNKFSLKSASELRISLIACHAGVGDIPKEIQKLVTGA